MNSSVFTKERLLAINVADFEAKEPSPWGSFDGLLTDECFHKLNTTFPSLDLFEKHAGLPRFHGQRSHDRWYLALEHSIYDNKKPGARGCVSQNELAPAWQEFITELRDSVQYKKMVRELLGDQRFEVRFAWHVASAGCDVSPHLDDPLKAGTHIFYFNTSDNWKEEWGGQTLFLSDRLVKGMNPEIGDFESSVGAPIVDNKSMLFRNTPQAWHGVAPIECDEGHHRRLFNVIFQLPERPGRKPHIVKRLANRTRRLLAGQ